MSTVMTTEVLLRAAAVVDPSSVPNPFDGSLSDALDAVIAFAFAIDQQHGPDAQTEMTGMLRHSDPDRVAEVCASALLRLARQSG